MVSNRLESVEFDIPTHLLLFPLHKTLKNGMKYDLEIDGDVIFKGLLLTPPSQFDTQNHIFL